MEDLNRTFCEKFAPLAISTPVKRSNAKLCEKRNFRTSTPLPKEDERYERRHLVKSAYEDWMRHLGLPSAKFKVRGMRNPPADFISGQIIFASRVAKSNEVDRRRLTVEEYARAIEARNRSICDRILPMLQKGLRKFSFSANTKKDSQKLGNVKTNSFLMLNYLNMKCKH